MSKQLHTLLTPFDCCKKTLAYLFAVVERVLKKSVFAIYLDTIEITGVILKLHIRQSNQKQAIMLGLLYNVKRENLKEKYNRLGLRSANLAKRFKYINE